MNNLHENATGISEVSNYGILVRIKKIFSKIFSKDTTLYLTETDLSQTIEKDEKDVLFENKYGTIDTLQIQALFEEGKILESELPDKKLSALKKLYVEQIVNLDLKF